jgi:hypothetical protein
MTSTNKEFVYSRIRIFAGKEIDPNSDVEVEGLLRNKFNILLPQRRLMNESLLATTSDHEIIHLILKYRTMD